MNMTEKLLTEMLNHRNLIEYQPLHEIANKFGFQQGPTQTGRYSQRAGLKFEISGLRRIVIVLSI